MAGVVAFSSRRPEDCRAGTRPVPGAVFGEEVAVEDEREKLLKLKLAQDEGEDVEGHRLEPTELDQEKLRLERDADEGDDVEGHKL
jgi:hypothetical protein